MNYRLKSLGLHTPKSIKPVSRDAKLLAVRQLATQLGLSLIPAAKLHTRVNVHRANVGNTNLQGQRLA